MLKENPKIFKDTKNGPWFCDSGEVADNLGSICGFVIHHPHLDRVVLIISLKTASLNAFDGSFDNDYKKIVKRFSDRLCLEYSLKEIKRLTTQETSNAAL